MLFLDTPPAPTSQHLEQQAPAHPLPDDRTGHFTITIGR